MLVLSFLLYFFMLTFSSCNAEINLSGRVVYAVNCGGGQHNGAYGINYQADTSQQGVVSDYGTRFEFVNAPEKDRLLYTTERYANKDFSYTIPISEGNFVLILKFSEVFFSSPNKKVFDVKLNDILIISDLDIYDEVSGKGYALDRTVEFTIRRGSVKFNGQTVPFANNLELKFVKGKHDNPKINAFAVLTGDSSDLPVPPLAFIEEGNETYEHREQSEKDREDREHVLDDQEMTSGPPLTNPYSENDNLTTIVVLLVLGCIIPIAYFVSKL